MVDIHSLSKLETHLLPDSWIGSSAEKSGFRPKVRDIFVAQMEITRWSPSYKCHSPWLPPNPLPLFPQYESFHPGLGCQVLLQVIQRPHAPHNTPQVGRRHSHRVPLWEEPIHCRPSIPSQIYYSHGWVHHGWGTSMPGWDVMGVRYTLAAVWCTGCPSLVLRGTHMSKYIPWLGLGWVMIRSCVSCARAG